MDAPAGQRRGCLKGRVRLSRDFCKNHRTEGDTAPMSHGIPLITTLASALGLALVLGVLAIRIKLPALVGYLLAGVLIGPFTPGFVADGGIAGELAEIGVMLLMFGVGLHFSLDDLLSVRRIALPGAVLQIVAATALGAGVASTWGWGVGAALVFRSGPCPSPVPWFSCGPWRPAAYWTP